MKNILCILFLISSKFSISQDIDVTVLKGELYKDKIINTTLLFSESDGNDGLIIVRNNEAVLTYNPYPKEYYIEHYDKELNLVNKITFTNDKNSLFKGMIVNNGNVNLIQFNYDKDNKIVQVNILASKIEDLKFNKRLLRSFTIEDFSEYFGNSGSDFMHNEFKFISENPFGKLDFSENKNFFSIRFENIERKNQDFYFVIYDNNFQKKYEVKHTNSDKFCDLESIKLSNHDGSLLLLQKNFENESRRYERKGEVNYHFELFKYNDTIKNKIKLKENNNFISSLFILSKSKSIGLVGFYSSEGVAYLEGVCYFDLDLNNLKINQKSFEPLSEQFFEDKYKKGIEQKSKRIINLENRSLILDEEENIIISAEEYDIETPNLSRQNIVFQSQINNSDFAKKYIHHFDDILSIKINNKGKILWSRNINKRQLGLKKSSFVSTYLNGNVYYFFNSHLKEFDNRVEFIQSDPRKSNLYMVVVNKDGVQYKKLIEEKESDSWYDVRNGIVSKDLKSVIFQGIKKREKRIIKISIE